jgi:hypothetical protein
VYEFLLLKRRPCVFVNAHGVEWTEDPDYAFWHLGIVTAPDAVVPAIMSALSDPERFADAQQEAVDDTFGPLEGAAERAADAILASFGEPR